MGRPSIGDRPMSNAERQKAYRQRQKANRPLRMTKEQLAKAQGSSRTSVWRLKVVASWAPELLSDIQNGKTELYPAFKVAVKRKRNAELGWLIDNGYLSGGDHQWMRKAL